MVGVIVTLDEVREDLGQPMSSNEENQRHFGPESALDYLIGEKLVMFAQAAEHHSEFAKELPRFLAAIWQVFNKYELAGYVASQKPATRKRLRSLLYMN